jgi:hypothetical protein
MSERRKTTREEAASRIAQRYLAWAAIFQCARVDRGHDRAMALGMNAERRSRGHGGT